MPELKEILNSITQQKNTDLLNDENQSDYVPFVVNRCLSYYPDTILIANKINQYGALPKVIQYKWYISTVPSKRRYAPWMKYKQPEAIALLQAYYGCSAKKAKMLLPHTNKKLLEEIKTLLSTGGIKPNK